MSPGARKGGQGSEDEGLGLLGLVGVVRASFGVAGLRANDTLDELIMRAERAMYQAKKMGGNRVISISQIAQVIEA